MRDEFITGIEQVEFVSVYQSEHRNHRCRVGDIRDLSYKEFLPGAIVGDRLLVKQMLRDLFVRMT